MQVLPRNELHSQESTRQCCPRSAKNREAGAALEPASAASEGILVPASAIRRQRKPRHLAPTAMGCRWPRRGNSSENRRFCKQDPGISSQESFATAGHDKSESGPRKKAPWQGKGPNLRYDPLRAGPGPTLKTELFESPEVDTSVRSKHSDKILVLTQQVG